MDINNLYSSRFEQAYGVLCSTLNAAGERKGVYPTLCRIPVGGSTSPHAHFESEIFYVISGLGHVVVNNEAPQEINSGDVLQIPPHTHHTLLQAGAEELVLLSVYSEDFALPALGGEYLVTAAPPTPNGPLHLGHMSGPYLASDVLTRYLRARKQKVQTLSGTDDHQNYVHERALGLGQDGESFRQNMRIRMIKGLDFMQIHFDEFIEPKTNSAYQKKILRFFNEAVKKGVIVREQMDLPHCAHCSLSLIDVLVEGKCPHCHSGSRGGCEVCGMVVPPQELLDPKCTRCGSLAEMQPIFVHTFDLGQHFPALTEDLKPLALPQRLVQLLEEIAAAPNLKVVVSHPNCGGLAIPNSDLQIHVWFEMAAHYQDFALGDAKWVHHFGFDNAFYYLAFIPAVLKAMNPNSHLPHAVITNEFLLLDGQKFSTSRGHAIWADEVDANSDYLRLYLCHERPLTLQANFSFAEFKNFSRGLDSQFKQLFEAPSVGGNVRVSHDAIINCNRFTREMEKFYAPETMDLRRAARRILEFLDLSLREQGVNQRLMIQVLSTVMAPILPETAKALRPKSFEWISDWTVNL